MIVEKRTHYSRNSEREVDIDYILKNTSARRTDGVVKPIYMTRQKENACTSLPFPRFIRPDTSAKLIIREK